MEVISVGSSSSGNSYIIATENSTVILDVGLPAKHIINALHRTGRSPEDVDAILITHEHIDHVRSVRAMGRQCPNALFYASRGTIDKSENFKYIDEERLQVVSAYDSFYLKPAALQPKSDSSVELGVFPLSHDAAEPVGYTISAGGERLAVVTDCGEINDEIYEAIKHANILVLEANHDENMLMYGDYPYSLKMRIKSEHGHLSNDCAGDFLVKMLNERSSEEEPLKVMLAHLSFNNNAPFFARQTVEEALEKAGYKRDLHYALTIAAKDELTFLT